MAGVVCHLLQQLFMFLGFMFIISVNSQDGFLSIDCGQEKSYIDTATRLLYVSDSDFVDAGKSYKIPHGMVKLASNEQAYNLRSFPNGTRNCYTLNVARDGKYLVRASFMYANYDTLDKIPSFDIYLDANLWKTVNLIESTSHYFYEIIAIASRNQMFVCLVNTGSGTPFISSLELRPFDDVHMYSLVLPNQSFTLFKRLNVQPIVHEILRYPNDIYDRIWDPYLSESLETLSTESDVKPIAPCDYPAPSDVMKTSGVPIANGSELNIKFDWPSVDGKSRLVIFVLHFAEVDESMAAIQSRNFTVSSNLWEGLEGPYEYPGYLEPYYVYSIRPYIFDKEFLKFDISMENGSTHPPFLNAIEIYQVNQFKEPFTNEEEAEAMMEIKRFYRVKKNWQGDPCTATNLTWEGISCENNIHLASIISVNLTSNELKGEISIGFRKLKKLRYLDLSKNNLVGTIPNFLADLSELRVLNLSYNNLNGNIPKQLQDKSDDGILNMSLEGNPDLCLDPNRCGNNGKTKVSKKLTIMISTVVCCTIVLVALIILVAILKYDNFPYCCCKVKNTEIPKPIPEPIPSPLPGKSRSFTFTELTTMTDKFNTVIGIGGFGKVYHGVNHRNRSQVAVKLLSLSSSQGQKEFEMEANILTNITHKNLVTLVGYCNEKNHLALVYEYMAGGCLKKHLFSEDSSAPTIDWPCRLKIASEVAEGLDYLHRCCRSTIVHRDIKPHNILLSEKWEAKISDFGLSKIFEKDDSTANLTAVMGTFGYIAPECHSTLSFSKKSDVYSFGIVLLELITGKPAIIRNEGSIPIAEWVKLLFRSEGITKIVDSKFKKEYNIDSVEKAYNIAMSCVSRSTGLRPTMYSVLKQLNECLELEMSHGSIRSDSKTSFPSGCQLEMATSSTMR